MGKFLGKPDLESFPNAAKKGLKIFSIQQINAVSGYERLYRLFWNRKAEELCRNPSFAKWSKTAITGVIATEWSLKKTALLSNHATRLIDYKSSTSDTNSKRKQKADTVHQGCLSMLNEHKNLLRLDEELRNLKRPENTTRNKKKKILAMEEAMQGKISDLKKRQEALRKGLENMAKEKEVQNTAIVKNLDVNTTQLDSSTIKGLIDTIMSQNGVEEGCSDEEADSDGAQVTFPVESESDLSAEEGCSGATGRDEEAESDSPQEVTLPTESESECGSGNGDGSGYSSDEGEHSPSRKRAKME